MASADGSSHTSVDRQFRVAAICDSLVLLATQCPLAEYALRFAVLQRIENCWRNGHSDIKLTCSSDDEHDQNINLEQTFKSSSKNTDIDSEIRNVDNEIENGDQLSDVTAEWNHADDIVELVAAVAPDTVPSPSVIPSTNVANSTQNLKKRKNGKQQMHDTDVAKLSTKKKPKSRKTQNKQQKASVNARNRSRNISADNPKTRPIDGNANVQSIPKWPSFFCDICRRQFSLKKSFIRHLRSAHSDENPETISNGFTTDHKNSADSDDVVSDGASESLVCSVCGRQFRVRQLLAAHTLTHTGERPAMCRFPGCGKSFAQTSTRNYHERTHSDARPYVCNICGRCFKQPTIFKTHISTVHGTGARPHQCTQCQKSFKLHGALQTHLRTVHSDVRPHECTICRRGFRYQHQLARHCRALHERERPFKCSLCDHTFTQPGNLRTHMRTHTGERPFGCHLCGSRFAHSGTLKTHLQTHYASIRVDNRQMTSVAATESRIDLESICLSVDSLSDGMDMLNGVQMQYWEVLPPPPKYTS